MGIRIPKISFSSADKSARQAAPNPNPLNFIVEQHEAVGKHLVVLVRYPDCTNYEGRKLLLYRDTTWKKLQAQGSMDPHFCDNPDYISPFARFEPTDLGWSAAIGLAIGLAKSLP